MVRKRVLSFMSQFSGGQKSTASPPPSSDASSSDCPFPEKKAKGKITDGTAGWDNRHPDLRRPLTPPSDSDYAIAISSPPRRSLQQRPQSRPLSMRISYQPSIMELNEHVIPELLPIFTFLNSQSERLYHEGYFLKLDDQNTQGKPNPGRQWTECFAQLVGTVLSYWDAEELDAAGDSGDVLPKFINFTDASIKMIESLPTRSADEKPLQNILSVSTAGRNRYLFHFNSHESLLEWTAGIRLSMFEHAALQEAYTGALIAGKGKSLNNINIIMERSRLRTEVWARVRFGAGVPWRRCWCVISPPDEKEYAKHQKEIKKRSVYDRSPPPILKGDIKFYDTKVDGKKLKKAKPIASITDAYSAYAVYPQSKSLVDASTLIKIEGDISILTPPQSSSEGFVFVMPETRPAISGFETMMSFLFPTWDTFGLYGRPGKLVASVLDSRSLMFAMPKQRGSGYLQRSDITALLQSDGQTDLKEREWRQRLKKTTALRLNAGEESAPTQSHVRSKSKMSSRLSFGIFGTQRPKVGFADNNQAHHSRTVSESSIRDQAAPGPLQGHRAHLSVFGHERSASDGSEDGRVATTPSPVEAMMPLHALDPVSRPPAFTHNSQDQPLSRPYHTPEMRQMNTRLSHSTLSQMAKAGGEKQPSSLGQFPSLEEESASGPPVPRHHSPLKQSLNADRSCSPSIYSEGRPSSAHSSAARPPASHAPHLSPLHLSTYHADSEPGFNFSNTGNEYPGGGQSSGTTGPDTAALERQAPPSPRPLPNLPPQDRFGGQYPAAPETRPLPGQPMPEDPYQKHKSITPNDIIDHYTSQSREQYDRETAEALQSLPPIPPQHQQLTEFSPREPTLPNRDVERPRTGVLKTTGGFEAPKPPEFDIPTVDFGPTYNLGRSVFGSQPTSPPRRRHRPQSRETERPVSQGRATVPWRPPSFAEAQPSQRRLNSSQGQQSRSHPNLPFRPPV